MKVNTKKTLVLLLTVMVIALVAGRFLVNTGIYACHSLRIYLIEMDATEGYWTQSGRVTWDSDHQADYKEAMEKKADFVEKNASATFLSNCGSSATAQILRAVAILAAVAIFCFAVMVALEITLLLIKSWVISKNKKKRIACRCR